MRATPLSRPRSTHLTRTHPGSATRIRPDQVEGKTMAQPGEAEMTSQQRADVDGSREPARAAADQQQDRDTIKKSYRYLRLAMVGLLLCVAAAVLYQSWRQGDLLGSVSAYYYTPAQAFFVGGLIGLGACMIALRGMNTVEDFALNLAGVFAAIVAIVPTGRSDYEAALLACQKADTPLLAELDCPTVQALADATRANVDNNLFALLAVGAIALLTSLVVAWRDRTLKPQADGDAKKTTKSFLLGFGVALGLWLAVLIARWVSLEWMIGNGHWIAAVLLFLCIFVVAVANARRVQKEESEKRSGGRRVQKEESEKQSGVGPSAKQESLEAARELIAMRPRDDRRYVLIARLMLLVAAVTIALWGFTDFSLFWVEASVFLLFMTFWTVQTFELESREKVLQLPPQSPR